MVDFPRGGGSALTPAERREISDIVKKEYNENGTNIHDGDDDDSLPLFRQGTKKRKADHEDNGSSKASAKMLKQKKMARNSNSKKQLENDASENEDEMLSSGLPLVDLEKKSIETLNYKDLMVGMKVIGMVIQIYEDSLLLCLPNHVIVTVAAKDINDRLESIAADAESDSESSDNDDDDDDDEISKDEKVGIQDQNSVVIPDLREIFKIRQKVTCILTNFYKTSKGKRRASASINPSLVNDLSLLEDVSENQVLSASVKSVEDHGYILDLGKGKDGFLPFPSDDSQHRLPVHYVLLVQVQKKAAKGNRILETRAYDSNCSNKDKMNVKSFESLIPGMIFKAKVKAVTAKNVQVVVDNVFEGFINYFHLGGLQVIDDGTLPNAFVANKKIQVCLLYAEKASKTLGFSINPWLLKDVDADNSADPFSLVGHISDDFVILRSDNHGVLCTSQSLLSIPAIAAKSRCVSAESKLTMEKHFTVGSTRKGRILAFDPLDGVFHVTFLEKEIKLPFLIASDLKPGMALDGRILNVSEKGCLVSLEGITEVRAFCPILQLAEVKLGNPEKRFPVDSIHKFEITNVSGSSIYLTAKKSLLRTPVNHESSESASVSLKMFNLTPELVGMLVKGVITSINEKGCIVSFYNGISGFIPRKELSISVIAQNPLEIVKPGQTVDCRVLQCVPETKRLILSMNLNGSSSTKDRKSSVSLDGLVGTKVSGTMMENSLVQIKKQTNNTDNDDCDNLVGFLPQNLNQLTSSGDKVKNAHVLCTLHGQSGAQLLLTTNKDLIKKCPKSLEELEVDKVYQGYVRNITANHGIFVGFLGSLCGLVGINQVPKDSKFALYDIVKVRVKSIDPITRRIFLSFSLQTPEVALKNILEPIGKVSFDVGDAVHARITQIKETQMNATIDLKNGRKAYARIHFSQVSDTDCWPIFGSFQPGSVINARVIGFHDAKTYHSLPLSHSHISRAVVDLSIKPSVLSAPTVSALPSFVDIEVGHQVQGIVYKVTKSGVQFFIGTHVKGNLDSLLFDDCEALDAYKPGQIVDGLFVKYKHFKGSSNQLELCLSADKVVDTKSNVGDVLKCRITSSFEMGQTYLTVYLGCAKSARLSIFELLDGAPLLPQDITRLFGKGKEPWVSIIAISEEADGSCHIEVSSRDSLLPADKQNMFQVDPFLETKSIIPFSQVPVKDGEIRFGYVRQVKDRCGLFVSLNASDVALVKIKEISDRFIKDWINIHKPGDLVKGIITSVDQERNRIEMSLKSSLVDSVTEMEATAVIGLQVPVIVTKVENFGVFLRIRNVFTPGITGLNGMSGLCHVSKLGSGKLSHTEMEEKFPLGRQMTAKIVKFDSKTLKISFSVHDSVDDSDAEESEMEVEVEDDDDEDDKMSVDSDADEDLMKGTLFHDDPNLSSSNMIASGIEPLPAAFDWKNQVDDFLDLSSSSAKHESDGSGSEEESKDDSKQKKRKKKLYKKLEEESISAREKELLHLSDLMRSRDAGDGKVDSGSDAVCRMAKSADDFERLLVQSPNSSMVWIQYMAFQLQLAEVEKARAIADRALKLIRVDLQDERFNIWMAKLNLEQSFGNDASFSDTFQKAISYNDPKPVYLRTAQIYAKSAGKEDAALALYQTMIKKKTLKHSCKVWMAYCLFLLEKDGSSDEAAKVLQRALSTLPKHKHIKAITKFAGFEFRCGVAERARTLMEGLISNYPKRIDLWSIYIDQEVKHGSKSQARSLFERVLSLSGLSVKKAKFLFKKYLAFEKSDIGDGDQMDRLEHVKSLAAEFISRLEQPQAES